MEVSILQIRNDQDDKLYKVKKKEASFIAGRCRWGQENTMEWKGVCLKRNSSRVEASANTLTGPGQQGQE